MDRLEEVEENITEQNRTGNKRKAGVELCLE